MATTREILSKTLRSRTKAQRRRLERLRRYIRRTNTSFKKMSTARKRVQIAKDVLLQLDLKRMRAESTYFESDLVGEIFDQVQEREEDATLDIQEVFSVMPSCQVCGIGSCFVATIDRMDKLELDSTIELMGRNGQTRYLSEVAKLFSEVQLRNIENTFESHYHIKDDVRLRLVMSRIIEKKGEIAYDTFFGIYNNVKSRDLKEEYP